MLEIEQTILESLASMRDCNNRPITGRASGGTSIAGNYFTKHRYHFPREEFIAAAENLHKDGLIGIDSPGWDTDSIEIWITKNGLEAIRSLN